MSRLEELIAELCPNGVEWKYLRECSQYIRGVVYNKSSEINDSLGDGHKILRTNNIDLYSCSLNFDNIKIINKNIKISKNQKLTKGDILICAGSGSKEHIGKVAYIHKNIDYTFGGFMGVVRCNSNMFPRYMYHILTCSLFIKYLQKTLNSSTINNLNSHIINNFKIPLPPLPVQQEIVRILDTFSELTNELTNELTKRKKQYEYYRDKLLTFNNISDTLDRQTALIVFSVCWINYAQTGWSGFRSVQ